MPIVNVLIDGKSYRMSCGEGEGDHLIELAADFDRRIGDMRKAFGEIGDMRLQVMAALTVVDELTEMRRRLGALEAEVAALGARTQAAESDAQARESRAAASLGAAAERVERMARALSGA
ncbi:cell division protein ZapA [Methylobacterium sp. A54F]